MLHWILQTDMIDDWFKMIFAVLMRGSLVLIVPILFNVCCRKKAPSEFRHLLIFLSICIISILPVLPQPVISLEIPFFKQAPYSDTSGLTNINITESNPDTRKSMAAYVHNIISPVIKNAEIDYYQLILLFFPIWITGFVFLSFRLLTGIVGVYRINKAAGIINDHSWNETAESLRHNLHIKRPIKLLTGDYSETPFTFGIFKPFIYLPKSAVFWPEERRRAVLLHELSHIKRFDTLTNLIARFMVALFWFNPLLWIAAGFLRVIQEEACDDRVLKSGIKPYNYASYLLESIKETRIVEPVAALGAGHFQIIHSRITNILNLARCRTLLNIRMGMASFVIIFLIVIFLMIIGPATTIMDGATNFLQPVSFTKTSRSISWGIDPFTHKIYFHSGIDVPLQTCTPIRAAADGEVIKAEWSDRIGILIVIDHQNTFSTYYSKLNQVLVQAGYKVKKGEIIAYSGHSGKSSNFYFETRDQGRPVNPVLLLNCKL